MKESLGLVEIMGLSTAVLTADTMLKTANVSLLEIENTNGEGYMVIKVTGDVGAVNAAVNAGKMVGMENGRFVAARVIARPSVHIEKCFCNIEKEAIPETKIENLPTPSTEIIKNDEELNVAEPDQEEISTEQTKTIEESIAPPPQDEKDKEENVESETKITEASITPANQAKTQKKSKSPKNNNGNKNK